jgi:hypothetical protein
MLNIRNLDDWFLNTVKKWTQDISTEPNLLMIFIEICPCLRRITKLPLTLGLFKFVKLLKIFNFYVVSFLEQFAGRIQKSIMLQYVVYTVTTRL